MTGPGGPATQPGRINWFLVYKALVKKVRGLQPKEIGSWTLAEVALVLDDEKRGPGGAPAMDDAEILASAIAWGQMTPLERLRNFERC